MEYDVNGKAGIRNQRYNTQYLLGNLLECADCGAAYRRRTERGNIVCRCATRVERGRSACEKSVTLNETDIREALMFKLHMNDYYDEEVVKDKFDKIIVGTDGGLVIVLKNLK